MLKRNLLFVLFIPLFFLACKQKKTAPNPIEQFTKKERFEISQNSLKKALKIEQEQIDAFIKRKGGDFKQSKTGVRTLITKHSSTTNYPITGNVVEIRYSLSLLNGDTIQKQGTRELFVIEYSEKESGLHEALKTISVGEKAIIIIPSHRAHGLVGDDKKIPALSSLVYQLELVAIQ